jgi:hypothetical protein
VLAFRLHRDGRPAALRLRSPHAHAAESESAACVQATRTVPPTGRPTSHDACHGAPCGEPEDPPGAWVPGRDGKPRPLALPRTARRWCRGSTRRGRLRRRGPAGCRAREGTRARDRATLLTDAGTACRKRPHRRRQS